MINPSGHLSQIIDALQIKISLLFVSYPQSPHSVNGYYVCEAIDIQPPNIRKRISSSSNPFLVRRMTRNDLRRNNGIFQ